MVKEEKKDYYINSEYKCLERTADDNCNDWDGLYCIECKAGHYIKDMKCDNTCTVGNCDKCNANKCFKCSGNLVLHEEGDKQECIDCSYDTTTPGVENIDEKCGRCPLGHYFNTTNMKCAECYDNCQRCTNSTNCYLCKEDHALNDPSDPESGCGKIENCLDGQLINIFSYGYDNNMIVGNEDEIW